MTATASRSQQPSADAMQEAQNCAICMDADASRPSRVKGCDHLFCYDCIQQWLHTKRAARCPLCGSPINVLLVDGLEEAVVRPTSFVEDDAVDLLCVDREFCAAQLSTVGMRVAMASRAWHAHGYGRRRTGSEGVDAMLDLLAVMAHSLRAEVDALPHGARFDPHEALQLAHRYQDAVDELPPPEVTGSEAVRVSHSISTRLSDRLLPLPSTLAAIGADAYDEDAWDDSDYDEDDAAAAFDALDVSVASGRAPPHRTARRRS